jgi:hypothetical protein
MGQGFHHSGKFVLLLSEFFRLGQSHLSFVYCNMTINKTGRQNFLENDFIWIWVNMDATTEDSSVVGQTLQITSSMLHSLRIIGREVCGAQGNLGSMEFCSTFPRKGNLVVQILQASLSNLNEGRLKFSEFARSSAPNSSLL